MHNEHSEWRREKKIEEDQSACKEISRGKCLTLREREREKSKVLNSINSKCVRKTINIEKINHEKMVLSERDRQLAVFLVLISSSQWE